MISLRLNGAPPEVHRFFIEQYEEILINSSSLKPEDTKMKYLECDIV